MIQSIGPGSEPAVLRQHQVAELAIEAKEDIPWNAEVVAELRLPDSRMLSLPLFWSGGSRWRLRCATPIPGAYRVNLRGQQGFADASIAFTVELADATEVNPFLRHGPVGKATNGRHFAHADGTPFFLLADSWWHGASARLSETGFRTLVEDRRAQGFNAIQICLGFACDMPPFDPRDANAAGHPWEPDYLRINPAFYDEAERRVRHLINQGLLPILVGMWGYHQHFMGFERVKCHWRQLIARFGALPVMLTLCGEASLPWYPLIGKGDAGPKQTEVWTKVFRALKPLNVFQRPLTVHPGPPLWFNEAAYPPLTDMRLPDFYFGMGGHGMIEELPELSATLERMEDFRREQGKPALIGECLWENMGDGCGPKTQRAMFWHSVLRGAPGHCYGADGLWQMNSREQPFGASPLGFTWGDEAWEDRHLRAGSRQVATGKRILERFRRWEAEPKPGWTSPRDHDRIPLTSAVALPGSERLFYLFTTTGNKIRLTALPPGTAYRATYYNPSTGTAHPVGELLTARADGSCPPPIPPCCRDWVLHLSSEPGQTKRACV